MHCSRAPRGAEKGAAHPPPPRLIFPRRWRVALRFTHRSRVTRAHAQRRSRDSTRVVWCCAALVSVAMLADETEKNTHGGDRVRITGENGDASSSPHTVFVGDPDTGTGAQHREHEHTPAHQPHLLHAWTHPPSNAPPTQSPANTNTNTNTVPAASGYAHAWAAQQY